MGEKTEEQPIVAFLGDVPSFLLTFKACPRRCRDTPVLAPDITQKQKVCIPS